LIYKKIESQKPGLSKTKYEPKFTVHGGFVCHNFKQAHLIDCFTINEGVQKTIKAHGILQVHDEQTNNTVLKEVSVLFKSTELSGIEEHGDKLSAGSIKFDSGSRRRNLNLQINCTRDFFDLVARSLNCDNSILSAEIELQFLANQNLVENSMYGLFSFGGELTKLTQVKTEDDLEEVDLLANFTPSSDSVAEKGYEMTFNKILDLLKR
jgi:hypothetical protein